MRDDTLHANNQTKRDFRQEGTDSIVRMLEDGVAPWQKPWETTGVPLNPTTGNSYLRSHCSNIARNRLGREYSTLPS